MDAAVIELPPLSPERQAKIDQFYAGSIEMLDRYIAVVELDMPLIGRRRPRKAHWVGTRIVWNGVDNVGQV